MTKSHPRRHYLAIAPSRRRGQVARRLARHRPCKAPTRVRRQPGSRIARELVKSMRRRPRRTAALLWASGCNRSSRGPVPANYSTPTRPTARGAILCFITAPRRAAITIRSIKNIARSWDTTAADIISSLATATAVVTDRSKSPSAGTARSKESIVGTPAVTTSTSTGSASVWSVTWTSSPRHPDRSRRAASWSITSASITTSKPPTSQLTPISPRLRPSALESSSPPSRSWPTLPQRHTSADCSARPGTPNEPQPDDHLLSLPNRLQLKTSAVINSSVMSSCRGVARLRATRR